MMIFPKPNNRRLFLTVLGGKGWGCLGGQESYLKLAENLGMRLSACEELLIMTQIFFLTSLLEYNCFTMVC